jgi:hypothetical protein
MTTESNREKTLQSETIKRLPEGSKAEKIRNGIEERFIEVTNTIRGGRPSPARQELVDVGQRILTLFDELLDETPMDWEKGPERIEREVSAIELEQDKTEVGDNRSKRFWEIDSEIGALTKKFDELYEAQADIHTDSFIIRPDKHSIH